MGRPTSNPEEETSSVPQHLQGKKATAPLLAMLSAKDAKGMPCALLPPTSGNGFG